MNHLHDDTRGTKIYGERFAGHIYGGLGPKDKGRLRGRAETSKREREKEREKEVS